MPSSSSTDNFLARRAKSTDTLQPTTYVPIMALDEQIHTVGDAATQSQAVIENHRSVEAVALPKSSRKKQIVLAGTIIVLGIIVGLVSLSARGRPVEHIHAAQAMTVKKLPVIATQAAMITDWPIRIQIPKINVDASLDYVGLTPQGALDTPKVLANAGWYNKGARPGEAGTAVIDGHFGWKNNIPGVFNNLHLLQKGDSITVVDDEGVSTNFVVRDVETYTENQAGDTLFTTAGTGAHLNLITCEGTWDAAQDTYSNRLVVFAEKD